jgi:hypothetical protein
MSALGPRFGPTGDARVFAGEVLSVELAFTEGTDTTIDLSGRQFALTVSVAKTRAELVSVTGEVVSDASGHFVTFAVDGDTTEDLFTQHGSIGMRVEIAELLDAGRDIWVEGALRIVSSAATVVPAAPSATSAPIARFVYDYTTRRTIISARGAPGLSVWAAQGQTLEEYQAALEATATAAADAILDPLADVIADLPANTEQVQLLANLLVPSGATAIFADSGNLLLLGDIL